MKKYLHILAALFTALATLSATAAPSARQVLDKTAAALTSAKSVTIKFSISGNHNSGAGTLTMSKQKFAYSAGSVSVWYNGKTQWTLNRQEQEVSITEPTAAELMESNPFSVISGYKNRYDVKMSTASKGYYKVTLTSRVRGAQIKSATVTVKASDYTPTAIDATLSDGSALKIKISSVSKGKSLPAPYFEFNAKSHPGVEVVDLR